MTTMERTDRSLFARWWWTVDRWSLASLMMLMAVGAILVMAASPAVADRLRLDSFHFVERHLVMMPLALAIMVAVSLLSPRGVRRLAVGLFALSLGLTALTLVGGADIKGAKRWLDVFGTSVQPSELLKPCFTVTCAWLFALQHRMGPNGKPVVPGNLIATVLFAVSIAVLLMQPDLGMAVLVSMIWFAQFFLAGLSLAWVGAFLGVGVVGLFGAYLAFPHVASRVNRFVNPEAGDNFQVEKSLQAFEQGGLLGAGPGEGTVKEVLPDAHADFIFAVAGEEMGLVFCLLLVAIFAFVVMRGCNRLMTENSLFVVLAAGGLLVQFGLQALINMGSALSLVPTKGMTLPFISYGGSSMLALAIAMGMVLALTRRRRGPEVI